MVYTALSPQEIRIEVLKEAKEQFVTNGIAATQMKKIARAVGIGRSTLYRYYKEKEQLAFLVTSQVIGDITTDALAKANDKRLESGFERLKAFFEACIESYQSNIKILSYYSEFDRLFQGKYPDYPEAQEFVNAIIRLNVPPAQFIEQGIKDGSIATDEEPMVLASVILNAVIGTSQRVLPREEHYDKEHGVSGRVIVNKVLMLLLKTIRC